MKVRRLDSARADTNVVPTLPCILPATDAAAQTLEVPPTPPNRAVAVDEHATLRIRLRPLLDQDGLSVVDADTAKAALCRSAGPAPDVGVTGVDRQAACGGESISLRRAAAPPVAVMALALVMDDAHMLLGAGGRRRLHAQGLRGRPDHRAASRVSASRCRWASTLTLRRWGGKPQGTKPYDIVRRDLQNYVVKPLVSDGPTQ